MIKMTRDLCSHKGCMKPYTREFWDEHGGTRCCDEHYEVFKQASEDYKRNHPNWQQELDDHYAKLFSQENRAAFDRRMENYKKELLG